MAEHWASVERGAAKTGRTPKRDDWRVVREVYIAETDAEAKRLALKGMLARAYREYLLPLFGDFGLLSLFKHDSSVADSDVTPEYLVEHNWLVGSPRTVTQKLADMYGVLGRLRYDAGAHVRFFRRARGLGDLATGVDQ